MSLYSKNRGDTATKDGKFLGQLYECAVCGLTLRKRDAVRQRGGWVHKATCYDAPGHRERKAHRYTT